MYHIHARVGYDHGPQVADPRAPEWLPYTEGHEAWWEEIWKQQAARGQAVTTVTPEHGPPNYQVPCHVRRPFYLRGPVPLSPPPPLRPAARGVLGRSSHEQQTVPGTKEPLADIWDVNHFIAKRQARNFERMFGSEGLEPEMRDWVATAE